MRLLDVETLKLRTFYGDSIPEYAILSHTWLADHEEVSFTQIQDSENCRHMKGFQKIEHLCKQAAKEGLSYAWADTCCIDKTSSAELSEAINSMFEWYRRAKVCYVYLSDVGQSVNGGCKGNELNCDLGIEHLHGSHEESNGHFQQRELNNTPEKKESRSLGEKKLNSHEWEELYSHGMKEVSDKVREAINNSLKEELLQGLEEKESNGDSVQNELNSSNASSDNAFLASRWWTRSWTLQELLAPDEVKFYNRDWICIGTKRRLASAISRAKALDEKLLRQPAHMFESYSVAQKMSWASTRTATRKEDVAYSLLGIFQINMPLLYGEGTRAFIRLQQEILRTSVDHSLFAWGFMPYTKEEDDVKMMHRRIYPSDIPPSDIPLSDIPKPFEMDEKPSGMFAGSPKAFQGCSKIVYDVKNAPKTPIVEYNGRLSMSLPIKNEALYPENDRDFIIAFLPCTFTDTPHYMVGILLCAAYSAGTNLYERYDIRPNFYSCLVHPLMGFCSTFQDLLIGRSQRETNVELEQQHVTTYIPLVRTFGGEEEDYKFLGHTTLFHSRTEIDGIWEASFETVHTSRKHNESHLYGFFNARREMLIGIGIDNNIPYVYYYKTKDESKWKDLPQAYLNGLRHPEWTNHYLPQSTAFSILTTARFGHTIYSVNASLLNHVVKASEGLASGHFYLGNLPSY